MLVGCVGRLNWWVVSLGCVSGVAPWVALGIALLRVWLSVVALMMFVSLVVELIVVV